MADVATVQSPSSLHEAYSVLAERGNRVKIIAGGTDLMVSMNARMSDASEFLDIWSLDELRGITDESDFLRIGALNTFAELIPSRLVHESAPALVEAARTVGAIQIQNRATIGGNIVNASPAGDSLPVLVAYDAEVEVGSNRGTRRI
ncbi:MAG TPA: FAD binding domain-containing protein, partial [Blastocatellia bacterium]|nr:FAD binding domain-containing protein [Blastocatellia bacterium]